MSRDWDDPEYKKWRRQVKRRDNFKCQMPRCGSSKAPKAHHIFTWAKYPLLRFDIDNGITLCRICHDKIAKLEHYYIKLFLRIIADKKAKKKKNG